jgi:hypothetical protein
MIAFRIQDKSRGVEHLLDPKTQYSWPKDYDESKVRHGVSGCESIAELAAYWATHSVDATDPVLVRVEGPQSEDTPLDEEFGEVLVLPETAEVIEDTPVWTLIRYLIDLVDEDYTLTYDQLVEMAEKWVEKNN